MSTLSRRQAIQSMMGIVGVASCRWLPQLALAAEGSQQRGRSCIVLWMGGGPSQMDTFDLKPKHANGGEFEEISTNVSGLKISEHLPNLAKQADKLAIVRSLSTAEGDHQRGTVLMHTGQRPGAPLNYPSIGSAISKELGSTDASLPNYVAVNPNPVGGTAATGPGFLGPRYAAASVARRNNDNPEEMADLGVDFLSLPEGLSQTRHDQRLAMLKLQQSRFQAKHPSQAVDAQATIFQNATKMMHPEAASAFDLNEEADAIREAYGPTEFGQGCLVARRLVERHVPFIEVTLGGGGLGWDTHLNNFTSVERLSEQLDRGWSTLMRELEERGLLETTTICWMGEFGRTPKINNNAGRDHFPDAWTSVLAGGGIAGGQAYGKTSEGGEEVVENKVGVEDLIATLCQAVGIDPGTENYSPQSRPIKISEGSPILDLLS